ncbi:MAG: hypothetical protein Q4D51_00590 [Eubacteriales bacterium]|nr:hypothetical protein [Eubacteriales bacterium]
MKNKIEKIMQEAILELNEQMDEEKKLSYDKELRLIGKSAAVDSMEFVTLISIIEECIADELDIDIRIVSDRAFSKERSPFYSVSTLEDFIIELIEEEE